MKNKISDYANILLLKNFRFDLLVVGDNFGDNQIQSNSLALSVHWLPFHRKNHKFVLFIHLLQVGMCPFATTLREAPSKNLKKL